MASVEILLTSDDHFAASEGFWGYRSYAEFSNGSVHALSEVVECIVGLRVLLALLHIPSTLSPIFTAVSAACETACAIHAFSHTFET